MSEKITVAARRNWAHDPRAQTLVHTAVAGTGSSEALVTDKSFSGTSSILATLVAGGRLDTYIHSSSGNAIYAAIPSGSTLYGVVYLSGRMAQMSVNFHVEYTDASTDSPITPNFTLNSSEFKRIEVPALTLNATKTVHRVRIMIRNNDAITRTIYLGGTDISVGTPVDSFVSGAGGAKYSWEGAADNSPSNRARFQVGAVIGSGGQIIPRVSLYVVDRQNRILRDITKHFLDGNINYDMDAENWKGSCSISLDEPGLVAPLVDEYLRPMLRIEYPDGRVEESSLGLFNVDAPTERWSAGHDSWTYEGKDFLSILAAWNLPGRVTGPSQIIGGHSVGAGISYQQAIRDLLTTDVGLSAAQYTFPGLTGSTPNVITWEEGESVLVMLNDILQGAGWQSPWVTPEGVITSSPAGLNPKDVTPSIVLATGQNSQVRWPFEVDPETSRIGNRIRVIGTKNVVTENWVDPPAYSVTVANAAEEDKKKKKKKKKKPDDGAGSHDEWIDPPPYFTGYTVTPYPVDFTAQNIDPAHPLSFPRLGRWMDLPTITVSVPTDEAGVQAIAKQELLNASNIPLRVRLTTEVMIRGLGEVYELDLSDAYGNPIRSGQGRYLCRGWTLQLGSPWEMIHNLKRVVTFDVAAGG